jgi:molecular chaperone DnaK (HSP70)
MKIKIDMNDWIKFNTLLGFMKGALEGISMRSDTPEEIKKACKIACEKYEKTMSKKNEKEYNINFINNNITYFAVDIFC